MGHLRIKVALRKPNHFPFVILAPSPSGRGLGEGLVRTKHLPPFSGLSMLRTLSPNPSPSGRGELEWKMEKDLF